MNNTTRRRHMSSSRYRRSAFHDGTLKSQSLSLSDKRALQFMNLPQTSHALVSASTNKAKHLGPFPLTWKSLHAPTNAKQT